METNARFWVIKPILGSDAVFLSGLPDAGPKDYEYGLGVPLQDRHPTGEDAEMFYDPAHPDKTRLYDFVDNLDGLLIGSGRVKSTLENMGVEQVEFLQVRLMDHKDKFVSEDYFIINPIGGIDIIDMEKSEYVMGSIIKTQIKWITKLVVNHEPIPEKARLFRASSKLNEYFISDDVKNALKKAGITGFRAISADGWNGR